MNWNVSNSMIESVLKQLNDISKCRYQIQGSYGKLNLEKCSMECTGISNLSQGNTKKELYYQIRMILDWHSFETRSRMDHVVNCVHHDVFNLHTFNKGEKRNESHIREYNEKYVCITCKKEFTKEQYKKSIIPKSVKQLRKMRFEK